MASVLAVTLRTPWALALNSGEPYAWKRPIDGRIMKEINDKMLKAAPELCYQGEMLSVGGGCKLAVITRCQCS